MNQQDKIIAGLILFSFSFTLITALKFKHESTILKLKDNKKNSISLTKKDKEELIRNEAIQKKHPHLHVIFYFFSVEMKAYVSGLTQNLLLLI